jgi:hypothetical protein
MAILDLFRPKWRHSDPEVRKAALSEVSDRGLLKQISAQDDHVEVRAAAAARLHGDLLQRKESIERELARLAPLITEEQRTLKQAAASPRDSDLANLAIGMIHERLGMTPQGSSQLPNLNRHMQLTHELSLLTKELEQPEQSGETGP